jgi:hypothetical protein
MKHPLVLVGLLLSSSAFASERPSITCNNGAMTIEAYQGLGCDTQLIIHDDGVVNHFRRIFTHDYDGYNGAWAYGYNSEFNNLKFCLQSHEGGELSQLGPRGFYQAVPQGDGYRVSIAANGSEVVNWVFESCKPM